tara:strand:- start:19 stop:243 length:225 start_codon:yes stop_codon:yes gene_type:complete
MKNLKKATPANEGGTVCLLDDKGRPWEFKIQGSGTETQIADQTERIGLLEGETRPSGFVRAASRKFRKSSSDKE